MQDPAQAPSTPVPEAARGLWVREEIFTSSGYSDTTTRVMWLQTRGLYADLRVPADRPACAGALGFVDLSDADLLALARVQGFAGVLSVTGDVCLWRRDLDFQPPGETPDEARIEIEGDRMAEFGLHAEYTEIWRRAAHSTEPLIALQRQGHPAGLLVIAGNHFLEIEDRTTPLPPGATLEAIVAADLAAGRRDLAESRLTMRIDYGGVSGAGAPWTIALSTLPWREGVSLFVGQSPRYDTHTGDLTRGDGSTWRLIDSTASTERLEALLGFAGA